MEGVCELIGQLVWISLVGICICYFRKPLYDALNELAGFVGRSRYGIGDGKDDLPVTDVYVPTTDVLCCRKETKVVEVVDKMIACGFSAVPMLDEGDHVVGVLTLTGIAQRTCFDHTGTFDPDVACADLLHSEMMEDAKRFMFVAQSTKVSQIRRHYQRQLLSRQDFYFVFITETGSKDEPLLGLVTLWDVAIMGS